MKKNTNFKYWHNVLELEQNILLLVRSLRQSNLLLFISTLQHLAPVFFILDHTHYSRWISVFIQDLLCLPEKNPTLFPEFMGGSFAVNKTVGPFSGMAFDQAHEQNNRTVKAKNGYIDLLNKEDRQFLKKLELALPGICEFLESVEGPDVPQRHKEQSAGFILKFVKDVTTVESGFKNNPFAGKEFKKMNSNFIFPQSIVDDVNLMFEAGEEQCKDFSDSRFVTGKQGGCVDYLGYTKCFYAACASQVIFHLHGDTAWAIVNSVFYGPPAV